jgi:MFS family permease
MSGLMQRLDSMLRPGGRVFFGWYIVASAGGIQFLSALLWVQSYGAYVVLLQEDFGWSKTLVAGAFALTRIESGVLGPLQGWLADRYGPRALLRIGMVIFGVGFILFSFIEGIVGFYLTFALIAVGASLGGFATVMIAIVSWFNRHRAKAVAISQMGYSVGGLCVPFVILCLEWFGWRTTAFMSGIFVLVVGLPMVQLVRHKPEDHGEVADGRLMHPAPSAAPVFTSGRDFTARQAMRTWSFWLISVGHACALLAVSSIIVHLVPHLTEGLSYSLAQAGLVVALMTAFQMTGQLCGGFLGDRFNKQVICVLCMFAHMLGLFLIAYADAFWMVLLFTALHGLAWGIRGPLMVALRADYFGPSSFGTIMGFSSLIVMLGMSLGPIYAGYLADLYGNYEIGLSTLGIGALAGALCFALARPPRHPQDAKLTGI